jgi:outer membrane protein W
MLRTSWARVGGTLAAAVVLACAAPASAQVVQSLQIGVGGVYPRGFDARTSGDVLVADLTDANALDFRVSDFRTVHVFGEWNISFGEHVEAGVGVGVYSKRVPSVYRDLVNADGTEIEQDLRLRVVPITGLVRFLPFGRAGTVQPYVGAGVSVLAFRYSESGQFVDPTDFSIFSDAFTATGSPVGGVLLGGVRFPIRGDIYGLGVEGRYQFGSGNTGGAANGFLGDKIDLSGGQLNFTFLVRF